MTAAQQRGLPGTTRAPRARWSPAAANVGPLLALALTAWGCPRAPEAPPDSPPGSPHPGMALTVNGLAISEAEVALRRRERGPSAPPTSREEAVERVVELELEAQEAVKAGLDREPALKEELALLEARHRDARRAVLARAFRLKVVEQAPAIPEGQVRAFFDAHQDRLTTEYRARRYTFDSEATARAFLQRSLADAGPDELAALTAEADSALGPLAFDALPDTWREALSPLAPGQLSAPVALPPHRFIVLRLEERRTVPLAPYEALRPRIEALLRGQALERLRTEARQARRSRATVQVFPSE